MCGCLATSTYPQPQRSPSARSMFTTRSPITITVRPTSRRKYASARTTDVAAWLVALALLGLQPQERLDDIRIHGNVATPDDEIRRLAGVEIGGVVEPDTPAQVAARLRAAKRFDRVEVLKRFASIADPTRIVLVLIV